ncbi:hypothetical protein BKA83DRAFT_4236196 [Pisolithus microcarpus]|nr:hypothetical protein BKA83DRAFT_4236196 [Pisolithus microcarpus]
MHVLLGSYLRVLALPIFPMISLSESVCGTYLTYRSLRVFTSSQMSSQNPGWSRTQQTMSQWPHAGAAFAAVKVPEERLDVLVRDGCCGEWHSLG